MTNDVTSIEQFASLRIGELGERVFEINPEHKDAALELQAALIVANGQVPGEKDKKVWDRVRPLAQVKADILAAGVDEAECDQQVKAVLAQLGTPGNEVPQDVPALGELLGNPKAGLVDGGGAVISQDQKNALLLFQAAARLAANDISKLAEPRIFPNDPEALKIAQNAVAAKIEAQKAGTYTKEMRQADLEAAEQAMQAFDELYAQCDNSNITGLTEEALNLKQQLSR